MSSAPKFVFECLGTSCPDRKCCNRAPVMVYFEDIRRWITDQTINVVFPNVEFTIEAGMPMIVLKKYPNETLCAMFNKDTNNCNIYFSKPISCSTYPLGYNGNSYYVISKECPGLGQGQMTKEALKEMRKQAQLDFNCRTRTNAALPMLQMLLMQFMQKQSEAAMASLSKEDKKKLEEILGKGSTDKEPQEPKEVKEPKEAKKPEKPEEPEKIGRKMRTPVNFLSENLELEGVLFTPEKEKNLPAAIVLHPHPQFGGSMYNNVVDAVCEELEPSMVALKFNCRGVGGSEGRSTGGKDEGNDVLAAIEFLKTNEIVDQEKILFIGYSWGTYVGLPVTYKNPDIKLLVGIACPMGMWSYNYLKNCEKPILLVGGTYDQFSPRERLEKLYAQLPDPKDLFFLETDHFYMGQEKSLAIKVSEFVTKFL